MAKQLVFAVIICIIIASLIAIGITMFGFFNHKKNKKLYDVHLCPEVKGKVLDNGKPVAGLTIFRHLVYIDKKLREDKTITQEDGSFIFSEVNIKSNIPNNAFAEHTTRQTIFIKKNDEYVRLWNASQPGKEPKEEFKNKLKALNCDLINPEVYFTFSYNDHDSLKYNGRSICRWNTDFEIHETF